MSHYLSSKSKRSLIHLSLLSLLIFGLLFNNLHAVSEAQQQTRPAYTDDREVQAGIHINAESQAVSFPPSSSVGISTRVFNWILPDTQGNPLPNSQLRFVIRGITKTGGHNHDDATKPLVRISLSASDQIGQVDTGFVSTGSTGRLTVTYIAPRVAGDVQLSVTGITPSGQTSGTTTQNLHVKIPGLVELSGSGTVKNYELKTPTPEHPKSYFGTAAMVQALSTLADEYAAENVGDKLPCNDMSIESGGIFDLQKNWVPPHAEHAKGVDVDIRSRLIHPSKRLGLLQLANKLGFNVLIHDGTVTGDAAHWHLRYLHGPDCEVYKRGKCNPSSSLPGLNEELRTIQAGPILHTNVEVSPDAVTGLFKYSYTFINDLLSPSEINAIQILVNRSVVVDVKTPPGWSSKMWSDGAAVAFAATDIGALPPGFTDDGQLVPSPFQIKRGQSLTGFSFLSPDPPAQVEVLAQGFEQIPQLVTPDAGGMAHNSFKGVTSGPANPTSLANQVDQPAFFVRQHYQDFLSRDPDTSGFRFWLNEINGCGGNQQCFEVKRINVSAAFFLSIEFQETGYLVYRLYKSAFGNMTGAPVPLRREEFLPDTRRVAKGVVVGAGAWQQILNDNQNAYLRDFVSSSRFISAFPPSLTAAQFVDKLDQNSGGVLSASERLSLIGQLTTPSDVVQRANVFRRVAEDADLSQREFNKAFVLMQYFGYLSRNPNDAPDNNYDGFTFWLSKLNQFNGNFVQAEMVKAFITSIEYRQRFGD